MREIERTKKSPVFCTFVLDRRRFEVMYETSGKFAGMVHVFDLDRPKYRNQDVVLSGAIWRSGILCVCEDDVFEEIAGLEEATERALLRRLGN